MSNNYSKSTHQFDRLAKEWFTIQKTHLKLSSVAKYSGIINNSLIPYFGARDIISITRNDIWEFVQQHNPRNDKVRDILSPKTLNGMLSVLKCIFKYAEKEKSLAVADVRDISVKQSHHALRVLSRREQHDLTFYLVNNITPCNLGILLSLYTGLRIGEICALKWRDVSFPEHIISVNKTMQRIQIENGKKRTMLMICSPKSECSVRRIPVPDMMYKLLLAMRQGDDCFLLKEEGHNYIEPRCLENRFKSVLSKCDIKNVHFHTLRHTFATRCIELGFDAKSLSEILGHSSVSITLNRYVHPSMELKQNNMKKLDSLFAE